MRESSKRRRSLDRRLKELGKESGLLRDDIHALARFVKSPDRQESFPNLKSDRYTAPSIPPPTRVDPANKGVPPRADVPTGPSPAAAQATRAQRAKVNVSQAPPRVDPAAIQQDFESQPKRTIPRDERFASLISSGGFLGGPAPVRQEKSVQRNKAIFMIVIVVVVLFIVLQLISQ